MFLANPANSDKVDTGMSLYIKGAKAGNFQEFINFLPSLGFPRFVTEGLIALVKTSHVKIIEYDASAELAKRQTDLQNTKKLAILNKKITESEERTSQMKIEGIREKTALDMDIFVATTASLVVPDVRAREIELFKNVKVREQIIKNDQMRDKAISLGCLQINEDGSKTWLV